VNRISSSMWAVYVYSVIVFSRNQKDVSDGSEIEGEPSAVCGSG
jgi:hypothetical protein